MNINLNGEIIQFEGENLLELLTSRGCNLQTVVVMRNDEVILAENFIFTTLAEDDQILILAFVGGG